MAGENMYTELEYNVPTTAVSPEMDIESQESNATPEVVSFACWVHAPERSLVTKYAESVVISRTTTAQDKPLLTRDRMHVSRACSL